MPRRETREHGEEKQARANGGAAGFFAAARERVSKESGGYPAPLEIVACVEAAVTKPFDEGLSIEHERFEFLVNTPESKALRHVFFAEHEVAQRAAGFLRRWINDRLVTAIDAGPG